jgi:hypothetical protein
MEYTKPTVADYGDLLDITEAQTPIGDLDGADFSDPNHHSLPVP